MELDYSLSVTKQNWRVSRHSVIRRQSLRVLHSLNASASKNVQLREITCILGLEFEQGWKCRNHVAPLDLKTEGWKRFCASALPQLVFRTPC